MRMYLIIWDMIYKEARWHTTDSWGYVFAGNVKITAFTPKGMFEKLKEIYLK